MIVCNQIHVSEYLHFKVKLSIVQSLYALTTKSPVLPVVTTFVVLLHDFHSFLCFFLVPGGEKFRPRDRDLVPDRFIGVRDSELYSVADPCSKLCSDDTRCSGCSGLRYRSLFMGFGFFDGLDLLDIHTDVFEYF